ESENPSPGHWRSGPTTPASDHASGQSLAASSPLKSNTIDLRPLLLPLPRLVGEGRGEGYQPYPSYPASSCRRRRDLARRDEPGGHPHRKPRSGASSSLSRASWERAGERATTPTPSTKPSS